MLGARSHLPPLQLDFSFYFFKEVFSVYLE